MKGLEEKTDAGTVFLVVKHHSICQESKEERAGFMPKEVKHPRTGEVITKYIKPYNGVEALVCKMEWYDRTHGDDRYIGWKLHLNANGFPCILDLPFESRACNRFMKTAENIDFSRPVEFRAWFDKKSEATAFYIGQEGESVRQAYTKEEPGECPPPVQNPVTKKWNFDAQKEYLHRRMVDVVIPMIEEADNIMPQLEYAQAASVGSRQSHTPEEDLSDDDIPF